MREEEQLVSDELDGDNSDTFLYQYHECEIWDSKLLHRFIQRSLALLSSYETKGLTIYTKELLTTLTDRLLYIYGGNAYHYSAADLFEIKNWSAGIEREDLPYFAEESRVMIGRILSLFASNINCSRSLH